MGYSPGVFRTRAEGDVESALRKIGFDIERLRDFVNGCPLIPGVLSATSQTMVAGSNVVFHKLGRKPVGWIVTKATGAVEAVYETASDDKSVTLNSANTATLNFWFF
jgi:hypothetical protein